MAAEPGGRPRVLYLITNQISSRFLRGQLGFLVEHGYDVTVATNLEGRDGAALFDDGVQVVDVPFERAPRPLADLRALFATVALIRRLRPALVNASTPKAGLLGMLAAFVCRVPARVYVVRGLRFETATGWRRRLYRRLEALAIGCATLAVFNSPSLRAAAARERLLRRTDGRVLGAGSGNGVDLDFLAGRPSRAAAREALGLPAGARVVGYVGRLTRDKGVADLVDAFGRLAAMRPQLWLLLVGSVDPSDPVPPGALDVIERDPRIVLLPWRDDIRPVYSAIDVLAFPSYREGMPNVVLEAQACGVPVAGYAATGTVDGVPPGLRHHLAPPGDVDALAAALADLVDAPARAAAAGMEAQRWVEREFRQRAHWSRIERLYATLLGERRTASAGRVSTEAGSAASRAEPASGDPA